ncbi:uncharacterized protein LOC134278548 [Saccostrea cucullata]|uniref:uncharacterized protein LOC134278548 n=1 Tax=Saccostrea cuccullata TaxID=36930 RepID=UPI002ED439E2
MLLSTDLHIYQSFYFRVTNISVTLHVKSEKYTFNLESQHCSEKEINEMRLDIVCGSPIRPGESFNACTKEVACLDDRAVCQILTDDGQGRYVCKDHSMLIKGHVCDCKEGQIRYKETCLDGNLSVGNECYLSSQCSSTKHANRCVDGYCVCQNGFLLKKQRCLPGTLLLGESCDFDEQCSGTKNAGNCKYTGGANFTTSKQCDCDDGFSNFRGDCLPGNLSVGQVCFRSSQCTHADPAARCVDGHRLCMKEYQIRGRTCVEDTNKENARTQKVEDISIIAGIIGYFLGLASSICASVVFKKIWKRSIKTRYRNTPIQQNGSNLALQNVLYKHSESAVCVGESLIQIQGIRKKSDYNNDPYSSIEETYNHLNDNTDLMPTNEVYDFAGHIETDQSEDTYSLAKALPSSKNGCQC